MINFRIMATLLVLTIQLYGLTKGSKHSHSHHRKNQQDDEEEVAFGRNAAEIVPRKINIMNNQKGQQDLDIKIPEACKKVVHDIREKEQKERERTEKKLTASDNKDKERLSVFSENNDIGHSDIKETITISGGNQNQQKTPALGKEAALNGKQPQSKDIKTQILKDSTLKVFNESEFKAFQQSMMNEVRETIMTEIREKEMEENAIREAKAKRNENPITVLVFDSIAGKPANNVHATLWKMVNDSWTLVSEKNTDPKGQISEMIDGAGTQFSTAIFKLTFDSKSYYKESGVEIMYPYIEVIFEVTNTQEHYHITLLFGPYGYTTYRGQAPKI